MVSRSRRSKVFDGYPMQWDEKHGCFVCPLREWNGSNHCKAQVRENGHRKRTHPPHSHSPQLNKEYDRLTLSNKVDIPTIIKDRKQRKEPPQKPTQLTEPPAKVKKFVVTPEQMTEASKGQKQISQYKKDDGDVGYIVGYMLCSIDVFMPVFESDSTSASADVPPPIPEHKKVHPKTLKEKQATGVQNQQECSSDDSCVKQNSNVKQKKAVRRRISSEKRRKGDWSSASPEQGQMNQFALRNVELLQEIMEGGSTTSCTSYSASPAHSTSSSAVLSDEPSLLDIASSFLLLPAHVDYTDQEFYQNAYKYPDIMDLIYRTIESIARGLRKAGPSPKLALYEEMLLNFPRSSPSLPS